MRVPFKLAFIMTYKIFYASVISFFRITRKITSRQLFIFSMVCNALAAYAFSAAWLITAITPVLINTYLAFHYNLFLGTVLASTLLGTF
jgi:hypothetical protein